MIQFLLTLMLLVLAFIIPILIAHYITKGTFRKTNISEKIFDDFAIKWCFGAFVLIILAILLLVVFAIWLWFNDISLTLINYFNL